MELSVTEAALAGFHLLGRRPVSFLVWTLIWIAFGYGALGGVLWLAWPELSQLLGNLPAVTSDPSAAFTAATHVEFGFLKLIGPWGLWAWLLSTVLTAAIFRSVLEPENRGFAYLRLGGDELRLIALSVIYFFLRIAYLGALLAAFIGAVLAARSLEPPWHGLADVAIALVAVAVSIWLSLRLILAAPMTFAHKRLQIFDSWRLTGGNAWSLLGLCLLMLIFIVAVAFILAMVRNVLLFGQVQNLIGDLPSGEAIPRVELARLIERFAESFTSPFVIAAVIVQGLGDMVMRVVAVTPFADAYLQLAGLTSEREPAASAPPAPAPQLHPAL